MVFQNYVSYPHTWLCTITCILVWNCNDMLKISTNVYKKLAVETLAWKNFWIVNQLTFLVVNVNVLPWSKESVMQSILWWTNHPGCQIAYHVCWNREIHRRIGATIDLCNSWPNRKRWHLLTVSLSCSRIKTQRWYRYHRTCRTNRYPQEV